MSGMSRSVVLIVFLVALVGGVVGYGVTVQSSDQTAGSCVQAADQGKDTADKGKAVDEAKNSASKAFSNFTIDVPKEGGTITETAYNDMSGTFVGGIPDGYKLWVVARDQYNYFLTYPPTQVVPAMGKWSQTNVRLSTPGRWELHVCLANKKASEWFQKRVDGNDWSGFPSLPEGAETVRYVTVTRK